MSVTVSVPFELTVGLPWVWGEWRVVFDGDQEPAIQRKVMVDAMTEALDIRMGTEMLESSNAFQRWLLEQKAVATGKTVCALRDGAL